MDTRSGECLKCSNLIIFLQNGYQARKLILQKISSFAKTSKGFGENLVETELKEFVSEKQFFKTFECLETDLVNPPISSHYLIASN